MSVDVEERKSVATPPRVERKRKWWIVGAVAAIALVCALIFLLRAWPFTQSNLTKELEQATSSKVTIGGFRRTFVPHPGCVADNVTLTRDDSPDTRATMVIAKLTVVGNVMGLFTRHVALVQLQGARALFPPFSSGIDWRPTESNIVIDKLVAHDALLEFSRVNAKPAHAANDPVQFKVHDFVGLHLAARDPMKFEVHLQNPVPPGDVHVTGMFGPWKMDRVSSTPLSGTYELRQADLGVFGGIRGMLSSGGKFQGTLESIAVEGDTTTPDFTVRGSTHKVDLRSQFRAEVDPSNGDVVLHQVAAKVLQTLVVSQGSVAQHRDRDGKTAALDLAVHQGRIQDLLLMFVSEKQAPLSGAVSLKAKATVPPGEEPFLKKVQMTGSFGIENALFTKQDTQQDVGKLSASARGQTEEVNDPESVVSNLEGHVEVRDGVANFSELSFRVPGAVAHLHGTFNLITEKVDLRGILLMEATLPQATTGIKSFLLRALDPFLKKNRQGGAKFPISITGTYQKPEYRADPV